MSRKPIVTDEAGPTLVEEAGRLPALRALVGRGGRLVRAPEIADRAVGALKSLRCTLLPLHGHASGSDASSVEGETPGHRVVAGARASRAAVALTVEGSGIRLVQHFGSRVVGWASFALETSGLVAGEAVDPARLGEALGDLFDRGEISRRHVVGALPGWRARSAMLEVPLVQREGELEAVIAEEAALQLGYSPTESYLFWQRAARQRRGRLVFAVVIPQETLLLLLEAFDAARIQPNALDLKPLALARAVNERDAIIANFAADGLDVVVVADDLPVVVRSAPLPVGISAQSARELFVGEVVRALAGYGGARRLRDAEARIYLAGSFADEALGEQLRLQTGYEIGKLAPPVRFPADFPLAEQLVNVGLALKGL
jgi:hypothetical protein